MRNSLLILALIALLISINGCSKEKTEELADIKVTLSVDFGGKKENISEDVTIKTGDTVFKSLLASKSANNVALIGMGETLLVTGIAGIENEGSDGPNWTYRVNGELGKSSCGVYELENGDHVEWTFGGNPFDDE